MNFTIPRKNDDEFILYIWKIIDMPIISKNDLIFKISFELFLDSPETASKLINRLIEKNLLKKDNKNNLSLSPKLKERLENWQKKRNNEILNNLHSAKKHIKIIENLERDNRSNFNTLIKAFLDKGTINRTASVPEAAISIKEFDFNKGIIKADIVGTKESSYNIEINVKLKKISHDCHDFQERRAADKKFCKHLAKLFLLLKDKDETATLKFLNEIVKNIDKYNFSS